jgi:peptidyl-prolyl cis-trans isomerase C
VTRVLPLFVVLALCACSRGTPAASAEGNAAAGQAGAAPAQAPQPETLKPVPAELPAVVARVNGEAIAKADFERAISELEGRAGGPVPPDQRDRIYRGVLDQLIGYKLLAQESVARNIAVADTEIEARLAEIRKQFPSPEAFTQTLEQRKMTLDGLRADAREGMRIDKMLQAEMAGKTTVSPAQLDDFYKKNPDQFQAPERVRASHVLIGFPQNADAAAKAAARTRALEVLKALKAGNDFADIAKTNSSDPGSAANGGDLGFFERGQMVGPFDQAAFTLPPNQISDLVETTFGYHIIKVTEKQAGRTIPLDEVRPRLQQFLENQNREQQTDAFVASLRAKGKVEILI